MGILVSLGFHNKLPWTGWFINNVNVFPTVLGCEKAKIKILADLVAGENLLSSS